MAEPIKTPPALDVWRNRVACRVCNFILNTLATKRYRDYIAGSIFYGLKVAALDEYTERLNADPSPTKSADQSA